MNIGFIGVGKIGLPLAQRLAGAGHTVTSFDAAPERRDLAIAAGLIVAESAAAALRGRDIIVTSLPHDAALLAVAAEIATHAPRSAIWVETSTVSPKASAAAALPLADSGIAYLRVTVSGNTTMAAAGQLTIMASGPRDAYERVESLFPSWGATRFYLGAGEEARLMKLVINLMIAATSGMLAEALTLGRSGGLAWEDMWQVIAASAVGSPIVKAKAPALSQRDFTPTFTVPQMRKDLGLILDAGRANGVALPLTEQVDRWHVAAAEQGYADDDYAAIIKVVERAAGLPTDRV